jgi:hypothetical protein
LLAACTTAQPTAPSASPDTGTTITDKTAGEIEALMAKRANAIAKKDLTAFQATFDGQRAALRRCQTEAFERAARAGTSPSAPKVPKVEKYGDYVRAYVGNDSDGYQRLYFRKDGTAWKLSEPTESELGGEKTRTVNGIEVSYFVVDEDVVDVYGKAGATIRADILTKTGQTAAATFGLRMFPTRSAAGLQQCGVGGTFILSDPYLRIYSNVIFFESGFTELHDYAVGIIQHEALHWLQNQIVPGITARLDEWLSEGWPDYIGNARSETVKKGIICTVPTPTFKQLVDGPSTDPDLPPEYYAFYNSMVEYLYVTYGAKSYFDFLVAYKDRIEPHVTYPRVLGITPEKFYEDYKVWAKKRFC